MNKPVKTTEGIRNILFDELERFLNGEVTEDHVSAVTKITNSIIKTVVVDLEAKKIVAKMNEGRDQNKTLADLNLNLLLTTNEGNKSV